MERKLRRRYLVMGLMLCASLHARSPRRYGAPALLPEKDSSAVPVNVLESREAEDRGERRSLGIGVELGTLARKTSGGDVAGMLLMPGGRVFLRMSIARKIFVKPSVGFFFRKQGEGSVGVSSYTVEGGGTVYYTPLPPGRLQWFVGGAVRGELLFSNTSIYSSASTSPAEFRFRAGPATGLGYAIDPQMSLVADGEVTAAFTQPLRPYTSLTAGIVFKY